VVHVEGTIRIKEKEKRERQTYRSSSMYPARKKKFVAGGQGFPTGGGKEKQGRWKRNKVGKTMICGITKGRRHLEEPGHDVTISNFTLRRKGFLLT